MYMGQYKAFYDAKHPNRNKANNMIYEHVFIACEKLGRYLKEGEVVHHKDQNKDNNSPDNLIVFANRAEHVQFHRYNCDETILKQQEDGSYICSIPFKNICPLCGEKKDKKAKVCVQCFYKYCNKKVVNRPTREELKQKIRSQSFCQIGKNYGISDNAIRNWCNNYNLPRTKQEIDQYTDEEWEKI